MLDFMGLGRMIIGFGVILLVIGGLLMVAGKIPGIGRLPGDLYYQKGNFTFYFPLVTSIVLSLVLTVLVNLLFRK